VGAGNAIGPQWIGGVASGRRFRPRSDRRRGCPSRRDGRNQQRRPPRWSARTDSKGCPWSGVTERRAARFVPGIRRVARRHAASASSVLGTGMERGTGGGGLASTLPFPVNSSGTLPRSASAGELQLRDRRTRVLLERRRGRPAPEVDQVGLV